MHEAVITYVDAVLDKARGLLEHFAVEMESEDLYTMLCGGDEYMMDVFSAAGRLMEPGNFLDIVYVPVLMEGQMHPIDVPFTVSLNNSYKYPRYLMPKRCATITPESKWYHFIAPGIRLAQDWEITHDIFRRFAERLNSDQLVFVLPWLKELGRDAYAGMSAEGGNWRFMSRHNLGTATLKQQQIMTNAFNRLGNPRIPGRTPAMTSRINQARRIGEKLFSQWRLLKDKTIRTPTGSFFAVNTSNKLLPDWYLEDMNAIIAEWSR